MTQTVLPREYGVAPPRHRLPDRARPGRVRLQVGDLDRSLRYYGDVLGLRVIDSGARTATLGAHDSMVTLVELHESRGARPVPPSGVIGLYHFALLLPSRADLGRFVKHLASKHLQFGSADHLVSEAIYLWDPDGLGIEVYVDRLRETWKTRGRELVMTTERLDLDALARAGGPTAWQGLPPGTVMGHLHLSVGDLGKARDFYHTALGLDAVFWSYPGALFMSAGGYHHHLATNTWAAGARLSTSQDARLIEWELILPSSADAQSAVSSLRSSGYGVISSDDDWIAVDHWGIPLRLKIE